MADIELIIKIPEDTYNRIKKNGYIYDKEVEDVALSIIGGTPLPGHGRLIILSEDKLKENKIKLEFSCQKWVTEVGISNATVAIIEADGGK